jgi:hypothetical protein
LVSFPGGTSLQRQHVEVLMGEDVYPLVIGDSHAAWAGHQTGSAAEGFERLFARLADAPGQLFSVTWREGEASEPVRGGTGSGKPPDLDSPADGTVPIRIRIPAGTIVEFGGDARLELADCELIVPAVAVPKPKDLPRSTVSTEKPHAPLRRSDGTEAS